MHRLPPPSGQGKERGARGQMRAAFPQYPNYGEMVMGRRNAVTRKVKVGNTQFAMREINASMIRQIAVLLVIRMTTKEKGNLGAKEQVLQRTGIGDGAPKFSRGGI